MWESGEISVATEHLASAIIEAELNTLYSNVLVEKSINKTVVVACVEKEYHQIGAKMVADVFELNGWNTYYLGSNMPGNELIDFIKSVNPELVALSLSIYFNLTTLEKLLHSLQTEFPDLHILVGGQAFQHGGKEVLANYRNTSYLPDLYTLESYLANHHSLH
jgi:methanogenic corrinoid protein MtbC1